MEKIKALEVVNHGNGIISVSLNRDHVRPELLPNTRQFLVEAISAKGGRHALIVDVSQLTYEDMVNGLQYRNGLTLRRELSGIPIHNPTASNNPALINELRYLASTLELQAKVLFVSGVNDATQKMMHKAKFDRDLTLRETLEDAIEEACKPCTGSSEVREAHP